MMKTYIVKIKFEYELIASDRNDAIDATAKKIYNNLDGVSLEDIASVTCEEKT